jgi:putative SOS response-associated peptidase YedK
MCYWVGSKKVREVLLKQKQQNPEDEIPQLFYNTFIEPKEPNNKIELKEHFVAIGKAKPQLTALIKEQGRLKFKNLKWTLHWNYFDSKTRQTKEGRPLLNSTCENVFWQHKDLIYSNRCVIPIDGYWEFYHFNGQTYPYFIKPTGDGLFYLGGIWNAYVDKQTGEISDTFSVISTPPNRIAEKLHNNPKAPNGPRMLLILDYEQIGDYLDESLKKEALQNNFLKPYSTEKMKFHPTIRFLKKEYLEYIASERVQEPFAYPELV